MHQNTLNNYSKDKVFCSSCGISMEKEINEFQSVAKSNPNYSIDMPLCRACTKNFSSLPDFKKVVLATTYSEFMLKLNFTNPNIALRNAYKRISNLPYWVLNNNQLIPIEELLNDLNTYIIYYRLASKIDLLAEDFEIKESQIEPEIKKYDIFVSHNWNGPEKELVEPLVQKLKNIKYNIWFDKDKGLKPGDLKDYLKTAILDSEICIPIFCREYFLSENTLFELKQILENKKKNKIIPIWWDDINIKFLQSLPQGNEILECSAITWKNVDRNLNKLIDILIKFIDASQDIILYDEVKLYENDANVLRHLKRIINAPIPEIKDENLNFDNISKNNQIIHSNYDLGFLHHNMHIIGIFLKKYRNSQPIPPITLPRQFFKLKELRIMRIPLVDLPPEISMLKNLVVLDLSDSIFPELPDLTPLKNLKSINLKRCNIIKSNPNTIKFLEKFLHFNSYIYLDLEEAFYFHLFQESLLIKIDHKADNNKIIEIDLSDKNLDFLPATIGCFKNLKKLNLQKNHLSSLPDTIANLVSIQILNLKNNQLSSIPNIITKMPWLKELYIDSNQLTSLPESIGNLINLQILNLRYNKLSSLPDILGKLKNLKELNLYGNKLSNLPESIGNLKNLQALNLGSNQLQSLPNTIENLINLQLLDLRSNQLVYLSEKIGSLTNLQILNLSGNHLLYLPNSIGNLKNLKELNLLENKLSSLPENIGNLTNLQKLNLIENKLTSLPKSIGNLKNLKILDLAANNLSSLPKSIGNLKNLQTLDLTGNLISYLPESIENLKNLQKLYLYGTQFSNLTENAKKALINLMNNGCNVYI